MGSLLPDIIDKPLAYVFNFGGGRSLAHTLLFALALLAASLYLFITRRRTWLLALFTGVFCHLILDSMWQNPQTLFWPVYGFLFPPRAPGNIIVRWISQLASNRIDEIFELGGLLIFGVFVWTLLRRRLLVPFLIYGDFEKANSKRKILTSKKI